MAEGPTGVNETTGFVAYILTSLPPSELENKTFRLQGDRVSCNELGGLFKTTVEHVDEITGEDGGLKTYVLNLMDTGAGSTGWNVVKGTEGSGSEGAGSGNTSWPNHQWKTIRDFLRDNV
jgi:hypothetical protein